YDVIPVNPHLAEVLGRPTFPTLRDVPADRRIDIVDIFRRSDQVAPIVAEAIERGVGTIWMQLGVEDETAAAAARAHGIQVYQDRCIMQEHRRLRVGPRPG
ncbi:MAG TPA: CoA-binding protein, partial [Thermoplasmata archaeon]|nr:CoA-binding protein [Thermoplasmata archaeon]